MSAVSVAVEESEVGMDMDMDMDMVVDEKEYATLESSANLVREFLFLF